MAFKDFELMGTVEGNYFIRFFIDENDEEGVIVEKHPITRKYMTRDEAYDYASSVVYAVPPKTKNEFFTKMAEEDYISYLSACSVIDGLYANFNALGDDQKDKVKSQKALITKFSILPEFTLNEKEVLVLSGICAEFGISVTF